MHINHNANPSAVTFSRLLRVPPPCTRVATGLHALTPCRASLR